MAEIIVFPKPRVADVVAALLRRIDRLTDLVAPLAVFRDRLADQYDALGIIRARLLVQASRSYAIGALALQIEDAIKAGDSGAMIALQAQVVQLMPPAVADDASLSQQQDAAD